MSPERVETTGGRRTEEKGRKEVAGVVTVRELDKKGGSRLFKLIK